MDGVGYTFRNKERLRVSSCGYADDVLIFAESSEALLRMHNWTRAFFGAHSFKLNATKTKLTTTAPLSAVEGQFLSVNGRETVIPISPSTHFRYLGVRIALDGSYDGELERLQAHVDHVSRAIRNYGMTCTSGVDAINTYLVPQLDLGMRIIPHSVDFMALLESWRNQLQDDILVTQKAWLRRPNRQAFCEVTGMVDLPQYCRYVRTAITLQRLNTRDAVLPPTAWARLEAMRPGATKSELMTLVSGRLRPSGKNRIVDALVAHGLGPRAVQFRFNASHFDNTPVICGAEESR
jgi:hypothetical protein